MKRLFAVIMLILMLPTLSFAEDLTSMSTEDLLALRLAVNNELAARNAPESAPEGASIAEIFPDQWIARQIRDQLGKFSTKNSVTQEELNTITRLTIQGGTADDVRVASLEGVQYLHGLTFLSVTRQNAISEIPEWIGTLQNLVLMRFSDCPISSVPDSICNLVNLETLILSDTDIEALPEDIGNLTKLTSLFISHTKITELPESIYNLSLESFYRDGLDID